MKCPGELILCGSLKKERAGLEKTNGAGVTKRNEVKAQISCVYLRDNLHSYLLMNGLEKSVMIYLV